MNETKFDKAAAEWDTKQTRITLSTKITSQILKNIPLKNSDNVLDFGCGTGLVGLNIAPLVKSLTGADLSEAMLERFNQKALEQNATNVKSLKLSENTNFNQEKFDVIVSTMTMHHIQNPSQIFAKLADSLKLGGYLAVADLAKEDGSFHDDNTGVYHFGFTPQEFTEFFIQNGFENPRIDVAHTMQKPHGDFDILFCYAKKITS